MTNRTSPRQQLVALIEAEKSISGSEEGNVLNVLGFMEQALDNLKAGDYAGFLTAMDLSGQFAKDARADLYDRRMAIKAEERRATMYAAVQRINENTAAAALKWTAEPLRPGRWVVRPEGQLGTHGWVNGIGWEAQFVNASSAAAALRKAGR